MGKYYFYLKSKTFFPILENKKRRILRLVSKLNSKSIPSLSPLSHTLPLAFAALYGVKIKGKKIKGKNIYPQCCTSSLECDPWVKSLLCWLQHVQGGVQRVPPTLIRSCWTREGRLCLPNWDCWCPTPWEWGWGGAEMDFQGSPGGCTQAKLLFSLARWVLSPLHPRTLFPGLGTPTGPYLPEMHKRGRKEELNLHPGQFS